MVSTPSLFRCSALNATACRLPLSYDIRPRCPARRQQRALPLFEMEHGEVTRVMRIKPEDLVGVEEYLGCQKRFLPLLERPGGEEQVELIRSIAYANIEKYGLTALEGSSPRRKGALNKEVRGG